MKLIELLEVTSKKKEYDFHIDFPKNRIAKNQEEAKQETVGSNTGEEHREDDNPRPPPVPRGEEGNAQWDWTDPYHQSGEQNAVMHRMQ